MRKISVGEVLTDRRRGTNHDGEDTLLHLTGVLGTKDDHLHPLEVDLDARGRAHALGEAVRGELAGVVDDKVGLAKVGKLRLGRADEHVVHEEGVVGAGADHADLDAVLGIPLNAKKKGGGRGRIRDNRRNYVFAYFN